MENIKYNVRNAAETAGKLLASIMKCVVVCIGFIVENAVLLYKKARWHSQEVFDNDNRIDYRHIGEETWYVSYSILEFVCRYVFWVVAIDLVIAYNLFKYASKAAMFTLKLGLIFLAGCYNKHYYEEQEQQAYNNFYMNNYK